MEEEVPLEARVATVEILLFQQSPQMAEVEVEETTAHQLETLDQVVDMVEFLLQLLDQEIIHPQHLHKELMEVLKEAEELRVSTLLELRVLIVQQAWEQ